MNDEPVLLNAILVAAAAALTPWLTKHGIDADASQRIFSLIGAVATAAVGVLAALHARSKVMPLSKTITATGLTIMDTGNFTVPFATGGIVPASINVAPATPIEIPEAAVTPGAPPVEVEVPEQPAESAPPT